MKVLLIVLSALLLAGCINCPTEVYVMPADVIRILHESVFDDCVVTSSGELAGYPDENVLDRRVKKEWRSTTDEPHHITFDAGAGNTKSINCCFAVGIGGTYWDMVTQFTELQYSDNGSSWTGIANFNYDNYSNNIVLFLDSTYTHRYFRISFVIIPGGVPFTVNLGRVVGGTYYEFQRHILKGWRFEQDDTSILSRSDGGQQYSKVKDVIRRLHIAFSASPQADQEKLMTVFDDLGVTGEFVTTARPVTDPNKTTIYGRMTQPLIRTSIVGKVMASNLVIEECL